MDNFIVTSLFQHKTCVLPGFGTLNVVTETAETDFVNTLIKAPVQRIVFTREAPNTRLFNEFSAICELLKKRLEEQGSIDLSGIGSFTKDETGRINFTPITLPAILTQPVKAERVIRQDAEHQILVGDKETTNTEMTEFFTEEVVKKDKWWAWAAGLFVLAMIILSAYSTQNGSPHGFFGNAAGMKIAVPDSNTYKAIK